MSPGIVLLAFLLISPPNPFSSVKRCQYALRVLAIPLGNVNCTTDETVSKELEAPTKRKVVMRQFLFAILVVLNSVPCICIF